MSTLTNKHNCVNTDGIVAIAEETVESRSSSASENAKEKLSDPNVAVVMLPTGEEIIVNLPEEKSPKSDDKRVPRRMNTDDSIPSLASMRSTNENANDPSGVNNSADEQKPSVKEVRAKQSKSRSQILKGMQNGDTDEAGRMSKRQQRCKTWEENKLANRKKYLIGKKVVGRISPCRNGRYFVKWHRDPKNTVTMSQKRVEAQIGDVLRPNLLVQVTIDGLGPEYARWDRQHPFATKIEVAKDNEQKAGVSSRRSSVRQSGRNTGLQRVGQKRDMSNLRSTFGSKLRQTV